MLNTKAMNNHNVNYSSQSGVVLLESLIAILIFSIGILALVGIQAVMTSNTSDAKYRSEANYLAQKRIAEIWADPTNPDMTEGDPEDPDKPGKDISNILPSGKRFTVQTSAGEYSVVVTWQPPGADEIHRHVAIARVVGGA
jgi:type IV pilus assembly protein PilV